MTDKEFVPGLFAKAPHPNAPDFVKASVSIKIQDLGNFLREKSQAGEEWVNVQVKQSQGGKWYAEVDNWKPENGGSIHANTGGNAPQTPPDYDSDSIPF